MSRKTLIGALLVVAASSLWLIAGPHSQPSVPTTIAQLDSNDQLCLGLGATLDSSETQLGSAIGKARAHPDDAAAWIGLGRLWLDRLHARADGGDVLRLQGCAAAAYGRDPSLPAVVELQAEVKLNAHEFSAALALADQLLEKSHDQVNAWGIKSDALLELGRYREAAQAARQQMQLWPGVSAQARASYLHWLHGDVEAAKRDLIAALRGSDGSSPTVDAWLWQETARLYWHEGDLAGADRLYLRSLQALPNYAPALLGRARIALALGQVDDAQDLAQRALAAGAGVDAAVLIGDARSAAKDSAGAEAAYQQAETLGRRSDLLGLARFLSERGRDPARALALLQAQRKTRASLDLVDALGWAYFRNGKCRQAALTLQPLVDLGVRDARLWLHAGAVNLACGDRQHGRQLLLAGQALNPNAEPAALAETPAWLALAAGPAR